MPAFQNLSDGLSQLVKRHIELAKLELTREASEAGVSGGLLAVCGGMAVLGYALLNFAAIFLLVWLTGWAGGAFTALGLGLVHVLVGAFGALHYLDKLKEQKTRLEQSKDEINRSKQWLGEIQDETSARHEALEEQKKTKTAGEITDETTADSPGARTAR